MIVFSRKVFEGGLSGQGSTAALHTGPDLNSVLAQADRFYIQLRASQTTGTTPKLTVEVQTSNDGNDWTTIMTPINGISLTVNGITNLHFPAVDSTKVVGAYARLRFYFDSGTVPNTYLEVWATGRAD